MLNLNYCSCYSLSHYIFYILVKAAFCKSVILDKFVIIISFNIKINKKNVKIVFQYLQITQGRRRGFKTSEELYYIKFE